MKCTSCGYEGPLQGATCPNCGAAMAQVRASLGKRNPFLVISVTLTAFLAMAVVAGSVGYRLLKGDVPRVQRNSITNGIPVHKELPIQHGKVVIPEYLHGHGKLYFVPVGRQAIPVQTLADYYLEKFGA